ncbi:hypothetical protein LX64_02838 [Chitinophaga skermanii]|uniref:Uncharacterized protein n=1 Tax=Chitinophaga skermanii TaxID=331697 RepID=A0A327QHY2_9BACT|nr:hypothetical protein [Chitinophaga skermanii]RAJ03961.1 hypothetical protein LX64_02838 [Chitinophaga skermanii]
MKYIWFKSFGFSYIPTHIIGCLITLLALLLDVWGIYWCAIELRLDGSLLIVVYSMFFSMVASWWKWIAEKTTATK